MFVCEKCKSEHDGEYGSGRFCNSVCARGFSTQQKRSDINSKVSKTMKGRENHGASFTDEQRIRGALVSANRRKEHSIWRVETLDFDELSQNEKRKRILLDQNGKCLGCGIDQEWNGRPLSFQLDHINGRKESVEDNSRDNLRLLCPNCHTQTATWGSKNATGEAKERIRNQCVINGKRSKGRKSNYSKP